MTKWFNADGLNVTGGRDTGIDKNAPVVVNSYGRTREVVVPFDLALLTAAETYFTTDRDNDGVTDGFNLGDTVIPSGAHVESADMYFTEAAVGGTSLRFGTFELDGTVVDDDGFITNTEAVTASMTVGAKITGAGVRIGTGMPSDVYMGLRPVGTYTAGKGTIVIKYTVA